jgi:hypothetical protein
MHPKHRPHKVRQGMVAKVTAYIAAKIIFGIKEMN